MDQSNLPVAQTTQPYMTVHDPVPIFDTSAFAQMMEIADVMAQSSLIPESLYMFKPEGSDKPKALPMEAIKANCFLVVNQARGWGMDPFAVAQCTSVVRGKLMHEGKLIAAVLQAKLGVDLNYDITPGPDGALRQMKVVVTATKNGALVLDAKGDPKQIEGTVDDWHTGDKGPWNKAAAWPRQLRYRGAREWARAYAPGVILGVIGDDEMEDLRESLRANIALPTGPDSAIARLQRAGATSADVVAHVARETKDEATEQKAEIAASEKPKGNEKAAPVSAEAQDGAAAGEGGTTPENDVAAPGPTDQAAQNSGAAEQQTEAKPAKAKPAETKPAETKVEESAASNSAADGASASAEQTDDPEWMADLSEDQLQVYDRVMKGLQRVAAADVKNKGKVWSAFNKVYREEMRGVVAAMPEAARTHVEACREKTRADAGI